MLRNARAVDAYGLDYAATFALAPRPALLTVYTFLHLPRYRWFLIPAATFACHSPRLPTTACGLFRRTVCHYSVYATAYTAHCCSPVLQHSLLPS